MSLLKVLQALVLSGEMIEEAEEPLLRREPDAAEGVGTMQQELKRPVPLPAGRRLLASGNSSLLDVL